MFVEFDRIFGGSNALRRPALQGRLICFSQAISYTLPPPICFFDSNDGLIVPSMTSPILSGT
jgi:hypothetical protein